MNTSSPSALVGTGAVSSPGLSTSNQLAVIAVVGVCLGEALGSVTFWLAVAYLLVAAAVVAACFGRRGATRRWAGLCLVAAVACWSVIQRHHVSPRDVLRFAGPRSQLAQVTGVVDTTPQTTDPRRGDFGRFSYQQPATTFVMSVQAIAVGGKLEPVAGRLSVYSRQTEHRVHAGDRVRVTGWLRVIDSPSNPGEFDYKRYLADQGIHGRISLARRGNCQVLKPAPWWSLPRWREAVSTAAAGSLKLGLSFDQEQWAFLNAILLGRRGSDLDGLEETFREVGLSHILSVSGAHLGILLGSVGLLARAFTGHPRWASAVMLAVLGLYGLVVPPQVPMTRASIMAGLFIVGYASGRSARAMNLLSWALIWALVWRPGDLFSAGFQLSFGIVAGLLLFTTPVGRWLWPVEITHNNRRLWWRRKLVDYAAANLVACLIALPLVAYHFGMVTPYAAVVSLVAMPVISALLIVGYLKIMLGLAVPSLGVVLAFPVRGLGYAATWLAEGSATWPGACLSLPGQPTAIETAVVGAVVAAVLMGWFARRRTALAASVVLCGVALWAPGLVRLDWFADRPALRLNMFAVGDGSCYLLRLNADGSPGPERVLMFDCGSQANTRVGERSIVPALRRLGVGRIDMLMISHADMDHFNGCLAVVDAVEVGEVLMPPQALARARREPRSAAGFLVEQLRLRGLDPVAISGGWSRSHNGARLDVLWPPAGLKTPRTNETSLVLSVSTAGRRVILNGDIQRQAMSALLDGSTDLRADVCDLPHHGSYVPESPRWLGAVSPGVVLQSCGRARLENDKWKPWFEGKPFQRMVTARDGMTEIMIAHDGEITCSSFVRE